LSQSPPRLLYIDDDAGLRRLAERALARRGYDVVPAVDGATGVALAEGGGFDLIAVDHYMPGMDGLETLARLRTIQDVPPIVYVTGSEEGLVAVAALKAGAADYVVKTIGEDFFDLLANALGQVLERASLERGKAEVEAQLRASNVRLESLLREMNHRVANSLQLVSAMVQLQANSLVDPAARAALDDTQRRIAAVAQVHRRLYTSDQVESVDMQDYLTAMVEELSQSMAGSEKACTLCVSADPIRLPTDRAVSLGVIVNELVANACKYAYSAGGEVRIALTQDGDSHFRLAVEDDGVGIAPSAPAKGTGLGTRLIRAMAQSLQSGIEYDPTHSGVRATLRAAVR